MTGVSAFLFFSQAHNHHNQGRTTIMSQSFTIKDARTQLKEERINAEIDEQIEYEQRRDAYPEPEGDPSY